MAAAGFFTTFIRPAWRGAFHGPVLAYVHGACVSQRRKLGWVGLAIASGVVVTTVAMGVHAMQRDLAAGVVYRRKPDFHKRLMLLATPLGRVHPVYRTAGALFIAEAAAEVVLFDSAGWRIVAHWLAVSFLP